jgi:phosphocarrier protein
VAAASGRVVLSHAVGLHARPSVKLTRLARSFSAAIELATSADGPWVDAKSIVKVMAAKMPQHATLHFRASGEDAGEAVEALLRLVREDFAEGASAPVGGDGCSA